MITSCPTQSTAQEQQSLTELFNLSLWVCLRLCSFFHTFYIIDKLKCNSLHHLFSVLFSIAAERRYSTTQIYIELDREGDMNRRATYTDSNNSDTWRNMNPQIRECCREKERESAREGECGASEQRTQ